MATHSAVNARPELTREMSSKSQHSVLSESEVSSFYVVCVLFSMFVFIARPGEIFPFLQGTRLGLISFILMALVFFLSNGFHHLQRVRFPGDRLMFGLLCLGFVSIIFSSWPRMAFKGWHSILLVNVALFYFWLPVVLNPRHIQKVVLTFVLAAACLVLAMLFIVDKTDLVRLSAGASYDPNDIAMVFVVAFPFTVYLFSNSRFLGKLLWGGMLGALVMGILSTGSRGGAISLIIVCLFFILTSVKGIKTWHKLFVVILAVSFFMSPLADTVKERWQGVLSGEDYNVAQVEEGGVGRLSLWMSGAKIMMNNPVTGVGVWNSNTAMGVEFGRWRALHSVFLQYGVELGLTGLILFIFVLSRVWSNCNKSLSLFRQSSGHHGLPQLASSTKIALVGYIVAALFLSQAYSLIVPILLIISGGLFYSAYIVADPDKQD